MLTVSPSSIKNAALRIQRSVWRGHRARSMRVPKPPPRPPKVYRRPAPKVVPRPRHSVATLRRVWSRRDFEPANGKWLHTTDFGHLEYNMWEYVDQPPKGNDHGLRVHKVRILFHSPAANSASRQMFLSVGVSLVTSCRSTRWLATTARKKP
jgi:hypothetical protein